jgi:glycosyltransferase involved in cell wall biosynthesis
VAQGSSRIAEAQAGFLESDIVTLADVSSHERNWLLRHAELCLYPTMAEGFGLVPFEAARFGTATLHARFGPLAETLPDVPVSASSWDVDELTSQAALLLGDEQVRQQQIKAVLENGTHYTWARTAEKLVGAYRNLLANTAL